MAHKSDRRLYLDAEGNVVEANDPKKRTLLVGKGGELPMEDARRYGLVGDEPAQKPAEAAQKPAEPTERRDTAMEIARPESAPKGSQKKA